MIKFYVNAETGTGFQIFVGEHEVPEGLIEVPTAPDDIRQVWNGESWDPVPSVVPEKVTMRQARLALLGAGLLSSVEEAIEALPEPPRAAARIEWDFSSEVYRHRTFVTQLSAILGLTDQQVDDLFILAETLT